MKNTMVDLHNHLMARIEALSDEGTSGEALEAEIERSKAVGSLATVMIGNARLALDVDRHLSEYGRKNAGTALVPMLEGRPNQAIEGGRTGTIEAPRNGSGKR